MKALPFERNLIGQYSISLASMIQLLFWVTGILVKKEKSIFLPKALFSVILILASIHFIISDKKLLPQSLYGYDVNENYRKIASELRYILPGSTVAFSDNGFLCGYVCMKNGYKVSKCPTGNEDYFIKKDYEEMPASIAGKYTLEATTPAFYQIYKRK